MKARRHAAEMTYHPVITRCPVCGGLKSPLATVCIACYLSAKRDPALRVNSTGDLEVWVQLQRELRLVMNALAESVLEMSDEDVEAEFQADPTPRTKEILRAALAATEQKETK